MGSGGVQGRAADGAGRGSQAPARRCRFPDGQQPRERTHDEGQEEEHRGIVEEPLVPVRITVSDPNGVRIE